MQTLESLIFINEDGREVQRLAKFLTLTQTECFQFFYVHIFEIHTLKNNSAVSRSGYFRLFG